MQDFVEIRRDVWLVFLIDVYLTRQQLIFLRLSRTHMHATHTHADCHDQGWKKS